MPTLNMFMPVSGIEVALKVNINHYNFKNISFCELDKNTPNITVVQKLQKMDKTI